jgi:anti-sigma factor ChrR (cupin superfamily)
MISKQTVRSTYLDVSAMPWQATRFPGVEWKVLYTDPSGRQTALVRMAPGARLPRHRHVGLEQSFVLEGVLMDEDGACAAGDYVWRRPGSEHEAWAETGCVVLAIFDAPNEFLD